jgi:hypothetical protein
VNHIRLGLSKHSLHQDLVSSQVAILTASFVVFKLSEKQDVPQIVLDRFVEHCPVAVMVRATFVRLLSTTRLDAISAAAERQYQHERLFSELVALTASVATRTYASAHAA